MLYQNPPTAAEMAKLTELFWQNQLSNRGAGFVSFPTQERVVKFPVSALGNRPNPHR